MAPTARLALLALLSRPSAADLPVHCLRHQIAGTWEFTLGALSAKRQSCGHRRPDDQRMQPSAQYVARHGPTTARRFELGEPNVAHAVEDGTAGTWTMTYDEGFEVAVGDMVYYAFSRFELLEKKKGADSDDDDDADETDGQNEPQYTNISHCDETMVGWYRNTARTQWGCYWGRRVGDASGPEHSGGPGQSHTVFLQEHERQRAQVWAPKSAGYDRPAAGAWQSSLAEAINLMELGWRATAYSWYEGRTPRELNRLAGVRRVRPEGQQAQRAAKNGTSDFSSFLGIRRHVHVRHGTFDWRNKDGKNWLSPVVSQGDCGSCYVISTVRMLTARNRIRRNDMSQPEFSVSFPLYCSEYNQGCDGGYGFLQSKWSEDVGLVPESCAPFSTGGGRCQVEKGCQLGGKRYRATRHHYVGGYYGAGDVEPIKQELVAGGPLVMSFEPKEEFMYYQEGVYVSVPGKIHQEWEQVDHAVLLVGFGEEKAKRRPYWILQNSWGKEWGEDGFFRLALGTDESGCESIVVAADTVEETSNPILDDFIARL